MEITDRYIYAVIKRLPQKQREDIEKELRSLIEDMANERCRNNPPQKSDIESILNELGNPAKLASKYRDDKNYLIGPELFDTYLFILKIVMAAVVLGAGLGKAIELLVNPPVNIVQGIAELITAIISGAFQGFTWVTVIFAVNERFAYHKITDLKKNEWSISDLPEIPKKEELIKPVDVIISIIFTVFFIFIFYFSSQFIGVYNFESGKLVSIIPIFSEQVLKSFMPLILMLFCLSILKECIKLIIGKWNLTSGLAVVILNIISLVLCVFIFTDPTIWNGNFIKDLYALSSTPVDLDVSLDTIWNYATGGFIYIIAFGLIIDSMVSVIKGIKYNR
jgi:hypothetical protein